MLAQRAHGHVWTIGPRLGSALRGGYLTPDTSTFRTVVDDPKWRIAITGKLSRAAFAPGASSSTLLIVMHGCGGSPDSDYCKLAARAFHTHGVSVLRLAFRGADLSGEDIYHAGLTADLHAAVAQAVRLGFSRIWVLGYSLGGHACLRFARESTEPSVRAVAAVCPVLDLPAVSCAIDAPERFFYRTYVLRGLLETYTHVSARGRAPTPLSEVARARSFRRYDSLAVVPRFGFRDADDYYASQNVRPLLREIARPTLIVPSRHDPMVPASIAEEVAPELSSSTTLRWADRGGHCYFPRDLDLGERAPLGLESQLFAWLARQD